MDKTLRLTTLGFSLNSLLDHGETASIEDVHKHISDGSLFTWLSGTYGGGIDLSLYQPEDETAVLDLFGNLASAVNARRKFGVERNGLALLAAYCFEGLQRLHFG